jgi:PAS domain S-box-containing protein
MTIARGVSPLAPRALAVRSSEERDTLNVGLETGYRRLIDTASDGIWMLDAGARTTYANRRMATMLGYAEGEMLGTALHEFAPSGSGEESILLFAPRAVGQAALERTVRMRRRDGSEMNVVVSSTRVDDEALGASAILMVREATEPEVQRQAFGGPEHFRDLVEAMPQILWSTSADGMIDYLNGRWLDFTGLSRESSAGVGWAVAVHPDDLKEMSDAWFAAVAAGADYDQIARYRRADGCYRWMLIRAVAVRDQSGKVVRWFGTSTDIDAQKRGEISLQFMADLSALFAAASFSDITATLRQLVRLVVPTVADRCFVYLSDDDGALTCRAASNDGRPNERIAETVDNVYLTGRPIVRPASAHSDYAIVVPLVTHGKSFGAIAFLEPIPERLLGDAGMQLAELVATRTATVLESARLYQRERRTAEHLRYIADAGKHLSTSLDLQATLDELSRVFVPELADVAVVNLCGADGRSYVAATSFADPSLASLAEAVRGQTYARQFVPEAARRAFLEGRPHIVHAVDDAFLREHVVEAMFPIARCISLGTSLITLPLVSNGALLGSLSLFAARDDVERAYTEGDIPFYQELAQRGALAIKNAQHYGREHRVADILQKASLPVSLPRVLGINFTSVYEPGKSEAHIGGDWYDAIRLADGRVVISIGDVAGSGLEAAVTMSNLRHVLRGVAQIDADPIVLLDAADKTLRAEHDRMVTAFVGVLDPITLSFTYASAGHPPPYLRSPRGRIGQLPCAGLPLGLRERHEEPARTIELERGSLLVLYTDGLTESTRDIEAGERRIEAALALRSVSGATDVARAIHNAVLGTGAPSDDVAILTLEIMPFGGANERTKQHVWQWSVSSLNAESMSAARRALFTTLRAGGMLARDCHTAELVAGELLGNVMRHAPGNATVILDWSGVAPVLNVLDEGPGFTYSTRLPSDEFSESGRGLYLVSTLTETFHVSKRSVGGSHARAVLAIGRGRT